MGEANCTSLAIRSTTYLEAVVSPAAKFELALLIVEREPGDVNLTGALEDSRGQVIAAAVTSHHHVRLVRAIEFLVRTSRREMKEESVICSCSCPTDGIIIRRREPRQYKYP